MNIRIIPFTEAGITEEQLLNLIHTAFQSRLDEGINFSCSSYTIEDMRHELAISHFFVAMDGDMPVACCSMRHVNDLEYNFEHLSVHPDYRRQNLAGLLLEEAVKFAKGASFISSDTAIPAKSSVKWHLKHGFKIVGTKHFSGANYDSYLFQKKIPRRKPVIMKKLSLKELQDFSLEITKDIHDFCEKNGIQYFISYGSLIGAARHKGFIPWDDDMDIMMKREDYDKFCKLYKSDKFMLVNTDTVKDCYIPFGRVCDCKRTITKSITPWHGKSIQTGVWVDIFPLDDVPSDESSYRNYFKFLNHLYDYSVKIRRMKADYSDAFNLKTVIKVWVRKNFHHSLSKENPTDFANYIHEVLASHPAIENPRAGQMCCPDTQDGGYDYDDLKESVLLDFEDTQLRVPAGYHRVLTDQYGDYMKLPPKSQRRPLQSSYMRAFWIKQD